MLIGNIATVVNTSEMFPAALIYIICGFSSMFAHKRYQLFMSAYSVIAKPIPTYQIEKEKRSRFMTKTKYNVNENIHAMELNQMI